jgi:hypothetical protein
VNAVPPLRCGALAGYVRRLLSMDALDVLCALPYRLFRLLVRSMSRAPVPAPEAGGLGWDWSMEVHKVVIDGVVEAVVLCRVMRRPGAKAQIVPLSRRGGPPKPSVN